MARIRTIKPTFWTDEKLGELPRDVRLTFLGLVSAMADDQGRFKASARLVRAAVFPFDDDVAVADVERWLGALADAGRIVLYAVQGERYAQIPHFLRHQKIDRPSASNLPEPPAQRDDSSPTVRRALDEPSTSPRPVVVVGEEKEGRGDVQEQDPRAAGAADPVEQAPTALPAVRLAVGTSAPSPAKGPRALVPTAAEAAVLERYREVHPRRRPGSDADVRAIRKALAAGYSVDELGEAIVGNAEDEWHAERAKHELPYVFRDRGLIDQFRALHARGHAPLRETNPALYAAMGGV